MLPCRFAKKKAAEDEYYQNKYKSSEASALDSSGPSIASKLAPAETGSPTAAATVTQNTKKVPSGKKNKTDPEVAENAVSGEETGKRTVAATRPRRQRQAPK